MLIMMNNTVISIYLFLYFLTLSSTSLSHHFSTVVKKARRRLFFPMSSWCLARRRWFWQTTDAAFRVFSPAAWLQRHSTSPATSYQQHRHLSRLMRSIWNTHIQIIIHPLLQHLLQKKWPDKEPYQPQMIKQHTL